MKIACDITAIKHPMTGVQIAVMEQAKALLAALPDAIQPQFLAGNAIEPPVPSASWQTIPFLNGSPVRRLIWQQAALPKTLRALKADALYAFAYSAPWHCPVPYLLNVHDVIALEHPELCSWKNCQQMRLLLPHSIRHATMNIVSTQHGADLLMSLLGIPCERIHVIPLGVDVTFFSTPSDIHYSRPYILFVSNIEPKKDLDTLLDAYTLCADTIQADLVIVGRAAWKSSATVQRIENWKGPGCLNWRKYVPREELPGLYQHARAFVMPSITEGFGLPVLEAMAAGTPVIHSDHPALCEAAGNAGLSFPVGQSDQLAACLINLTRSPALGEDLVAAGKQYVRTRTWNHWGQHTAQLIATVFGCNASPVGNNFVTG